MNAETQMRMTQEEYGGKEGWVGLGEGGMGEEEGGGQAVAAVLTQEGRLRDADG
jgi:hypothetical protein